VNCHFDFGILIGGRLHFSPFLPFKNNFLHNWLIIRKCQG